MLEGNQKTENSDDDIGHQELCRKELGKVQKGEKGEGKKEKREKRKGEKSEYTPIGVYWESIEFCSLKFKLCKVSV